MKFDAGLAIDTAEASRRIDDEPDKQYEADTDKNLPGFNHKLKENRRDPANDAYSGYFCVICG